MRIIVEGAGDVVLTKYGPALAKMKVGTRGEFHVVVTDESAQWSKVEGLYEKKQRTIAKLREWEFTFFDKSSDDDARRYADLRDSGSVDVVFIATNDKTHVKLAEDWLQKAGRIFVEKHPP